MKLYKIFAAIIFILNSFIYVNGQAVNPERGDGFWTQVNPMRMEQVIWVNDTLYASRSVMYQSNGGIYRSVDGGINWDTLYSKSEFTSSGLKLFIHPVNHKILFLIDCALYKSTNGGQSWNYVVGANGPLVRLAINPKNPSIMYITKSIPFGTVYKTTDAGTTWNISGSGLVNNQYFQAGPIEVNPEYPDIILLGTNSGLYRSTNAGATWDTTGIKGFIPGVNFHRYLPNIGFASTTYDWATYKTTNTGLTWYKTVGSDGEFNRRTIFNKTFSNILYNSENLRSLDTGNTWKKIDTLNNSWNDLDMNEATITKLFAASGYSGLYVYTDIFTEIDQNEKTVNDFKVNNFPNPFNNSTKIRLIIPQSQHITIQIFNVLGELITTILNDEYLDSGTHHYFWDGKNSDGNSVSTGIYLCRFITNQNNLTQVKSLKLILLK